MKKILLGALLLCSTAVMANDKYDMLEDKLEGAYSTLTDGTHTMKVDDIDVDQMGNQVLVKLELESEDNDGAWSKFNKTTYQDIITGMADEVRRDLNTKDKVKVELIFENSKTDKETLLSSGVY